MTRIIVDDALLQKLHNLEYPLELCTKEGTVLACVVPKQAPAPYEGQVPPLSVDELKRRLESSGKTYSTAEVLAHLEQL